MDTFVQYLTHNIIEMYCHVETSMFIEVGDKIHGIIKDEVQTFVVTKVPQIPSACIVLGSVVIGSIVLGSDNT